MMFHFDHGKLLPTFPWSYAGVAELVDATVCQTVCSHAGHFVGSNPTTGTHIIANV